MKFRPCIDIHSGKVKQIVGGSLSDNEDNLVENFISDKDSSYYSRMFKEDSLIGGHVIMLGQGNEKASLNALKAYPNGLQIGGGINIDNAKYYINNGASHVIITSYVFKDGKISFDNLDKVIKNIGRENLVLDLSCRKKEDKYYVVTDRWQNFTNFELSNDNIKLLEAYCDEFLVHAVDVEGKCNGIEKELIELLGNCVNIPTTYAGGIRSFDDLETIKLLGKDKIDFTIGSALDIFGGYLSYKDVVMYCENL
ncbi:MAG: phosphoribosylformimino-5-aminoimidazole carboxamide ribotide isomerase [Clostridiaceae bacterium]